MNMLSTKYKYLPVLLLSAALWACESNRTAENTTERVIDTAETDDTVRVVKTGKTAEDQLEDFRSWINNKTDGGDSSDSNIEEEFRRRTAQLETKVDSLSAKSKAEYNQLKGRFERWEDRQERRQQTPLDPGKVAQWREQLLDEFKDLNSVTDENVREAYLTFMGKVRAKRQNWTQDDWDYVDHVYSLLNQRYRQINDQVAVSDRLKVRTLQGEYLSLEAAADTKSMVGSMRD